MTDTITLKHIDHATMLPSLNGDGVHIEIYGRRTNHGPEILIKIPFDQFCIEILDPICREASAQLMSAQERVDLLNGCYIINPKQNGASDAGRLKTGGKIYREPPPGIVTPSHGCREAIR